MLDSAFVVSVKTVEPKSVATSVEVPSVGADVVDIRGPEFETLTFVVLF